MSILAAILTALAIVCAQVLHGGLLVPAFSVPSYVLLVAAALPALWVAARNSAPTAPGSLAALTIFVGYLAWRCAHAPDQFLGRVELGQTLSVGLAFGISYAGLRDTQGRFVFLSVVLAVAFVQAIIGFIQFSQGGLSAPLGWMAADLRSLYEGRFTTRAHGFFLNPNQFAWLMTWATLFCLSLATWGRLKIITRVVLIYLVLTFVAAQILGGSRGGIVSLVAGLAAFSVLSIVGALTMLRRGKAFVIGGAVALVLLCVGAGAFIYSSNWVMQARVDAWFFPDVRELLLEHARRQFETAPLVGMGPGTFIYAARLYRTGNQPGDAIFAHDDWLQTLVEYGFVGFAMALLALLILLGGGITRFFRALRRRAASGDLPQSNAAAILLGAISATVAFAAHSLTDFNMHVPANALLAGATLGLLAGTGGELAAGRRLQIGILRALGAGVIACLAVALALFAEKHGYADGQNLFAANALAEGDIAATLTHTEKGLRASPQDAALLANRARALYSYESSLQFSAADEPDENAESDETETSKTKPDAKKDSAAGKTAAVSELTPEERKKIYQESANAFSAALTKQPLERRYRIELANALVELGRSQEAQHQFIEAIRLDPGHAYAYGAYGDHLYEAENLERALRIFIIGSTLSAGGYCGDRAQDIHEELAPPAPEEEVPAEDSTSEPAEEGSSE